MKILNEFLVSISYDNDTSVLDFYAECKKKFNSYNFNYEIKTNEDIYKLYETLKTKLIDEIKNFFSLNNDKLSNKIYENKYIKELYDYFQKLEKNFNLIKENNITLDQINIMTLNYKFMIQEDTNSDKFFKYIELFIKFNKELDENYTEIFKEIIESREFEELYIGAMESSYVKNFIKNYNLEYNYNLFMEKYIKDINKYILYMPLTRGIKAYLSNYFRIIININSIEFIGIIKEKKEIIKTYLLTNLLHESMHFIFRLDKMNKIADKTLSPIKKKYKNEYAEIGVDLIYHIFKTEYITFYNEESCKIVNNINSWKNPKTNFGVFELNYYEDNVIKKLNDNEEKNGLRCNNSFIDNNMNGEEYDENKFYYSSSIKLCH